MSLELTGRAILMLLMLLGAMFASDGASAQTTSRDCLTSVVTGILL